MESIESLKKQIRELELAENKTKQYSSLVQRRNSLMTSIKTHGKALNPPTKMGLFASKMQKFGTEAQTFSKKHKLKERAKRFNSVMQKQLEPSGNV